jgi:benzylsuccinate CoA-transferase BbsF subunit
MREEGADDPLLTSRDWNGADQFTISQADYDRVAELIGAFLRTKPVAALMERSVRDRILLAEVSSVSQVLANPHLRARGFFVPAPGPSGEPVELPGPFARLSRTPIGPYRRPPAPGEHTAEVLAEAADIEPVPSDRRSGARTRARAEQIFTGLKVADFTWAAAGPIMTKQLADNGATVVKIESRRHPDSMRLGGPFAGDTPGIDRSGFFADFNSSKLSLALDMTRPEARAVALRLARWADIVADSFRPGVLDRWGVGYDALREVNPSLIMVSSSLYGATGPWKDHPGYGAQGAALAGIHGLTGWPDRPPAAPKGAYTDSVTPRYGLAALVAALIHRERTGEGQRIELSQVEAGVEFLGPELLRLQVSGEEATRRGNRGEGALVYGVYPCAGEDRWLAIEVRHEHEWAGLVKVLGALPGPDVDDQIAAVTADREPFELADELRAAGVPSAVVARGSDLFADPILAERGHFWPLPHPEMGTVGYNGPAYRFADTPTVLTRAAPCLGQDTDAVLTDILGYEQPEIAALREQGILH